MGSIRLNDYSRSFKARTLIQLFFFFFFFTSNLELSPPNQRHLQKCPQSHPPSPWEYKQWTKLVSWSFVIYTIQSGTWSLRLKINCRLKSWSPFNREWKRNIDLSYSCRDLQTIRLRGLNTDSPSAECIDLWKMDGGWICRMGQMANWNTFALQVWKA